MPGKNQDEAEQQPASGSQIIKATRKKKAKAAPSTNEALAIPQELLAAPHIESCSPLWQQFYTAVRSAVK